MEQCSQLEKELEIISDELKALPSQGFASEWQQNIAKQCGIQPHNRYDCFIDVDGEPLLKRLLTLTQTAQRRRLPILFQ